MKKLISFILLTFMLIITNISFVGSTSADFIQKSLRQNAQAVANNDNVTANNWNTITLDISNLIADVVGLKAYIDSNISALFVETPSRLEQMNRDIKIGKSFKVGGNLTSSDIDIPEGGLKNDTILTENILDGTILLEDLDPTISFGVDNTFERNGNEIFYKEGNIGIGTNTPAEQLTVTDGNIKINTDGRGIVFPDGTMQTTAITSENNAMLLNNNQNVIDNKNFNGNLDIGSTGVITEVSDDATLADVSETAIVTEKAIKGYIDTKADIIDGECGTTNGLPIEEANINGGICLKGNKSNFQKKSETLTEVQNVVIPQTNNKTDTKPNITGGGTYGTSNNNRYTQEWIVPEGVTSIQISASFQWSEEPCCDRSSFWLYKNGMNIKAYGEYSNNGSKNVSETLNVTAGNKFKFRLNKRHDGSVNRGNSSINNMKITYVQTKMIEQTITTNKVVNWFEWKCDGVGGGTSQQCGAPELLVDTIPVQANISNVNATDMTINWTDTPPSPVTYKVRVSSENSTTTEPTPPPSGKDFFPGTKTMTDTYAERLKTMLGNKCGKLLYQRTRDGGNENTWHSKVASQGANVTINKNGGDVYGGYSPTSWIQNNGYRDFRASFLFNLATNQKSGSCTTGHALYDRYNYGPTFGGGHDWYVDQYMRSGYSSARCYGGHPFNGKSGTQELETFKVISCDELPSSGPFIKEEDVGDVKTYKMTGLPSNTTLYSWVQSCKDGTCGEWSNMQTAKTKEDKFIIGNITWIKSPVGKNLSGNKWIEICQSVGKKAYTCYNYGQQRNTGIWNNGYSYNDSEHNQGCGCGTYTQYGNIPSGKVFISGCYYSNSANGIHWHATNNSGQDNYPGWSNNSMTNTSVANSITLSGEYYVACR